MRRDAWRPPWPRHGRASLRPSTPRASSTSRAGVGRRGRVRSADHDDDLALQGRGVEHRRRAPTAGRAGPPRAAWSARARPRRGDRPAHRAPRRASPARASATRRGRSSAGRVASASSRARRSPAFRGRNPSNTNRSVGSPLIASAAIAADGPGTTRTSMPSAAHARTSRKPGSETVGMPPSVTSATVAPSRSRRRTSSVRSRSFPSKNDSSGRSTSWRCARSRPVRRVSSAAIRSTVPRVSTARGARSPRLPIGVPTR